MSRGLGQRQREIISALETAPDHRLPIHEFCSDLGDDWRDLDHNQNEYAKVRSAVRGLQRRGLVFTFQDIDDRPRRDGGRRVKNWDGFRQKYTTRSWRGTWVELIR
jgi:hypothetical protein